MHVPAPFARVEATCASATSGPAPSECKRSLWCTGCFHVFSMFVNSIDSCEIVSSLHGPSNVVSCLNPIGKVGAHPA